MFPLHIKKWRNATVLSIVFFGILLVFEVMPLVLTTGEQLWICALSLTRSNNPEQLRQEQNFLAHQKKQLVQFRKSILSVSRENSSIPRIISLIDSVGQEHDCTLISVQPVESGDKKQRDALQLKFYGNYQALYKVVRDFRLLPVRFTIKDFTYGAESAGDKELTAKITIELLNENDE